MIFVLLNQSIGKKKYQIGVIIKSQNVGIQIKHGKANINIWKT